VEEQFVPLGRVQQLLADLFSVRLGRGTLVAWVQQASQAFAPGKVHTKRALQQVPVLHHDETGVRRGGRLAWAHVASTAPAQRQQAPAQRASPSTVSTHGVAGRRRGRSVSCRASRA
jgi:transposase